MEETLETIQARHRKEQRDLQSRITNKKKNATKKTRKGVNDECAELERQLRERQERELAVFNGEADAMEDDGDDAVDGKGDDGTEGISTRLEDVSLSDVTTATTTKPATEKPPQPQQPPASQQQQQQQQQPAGKKRNRQKERLARRAAEQEAAAEAAEAEAAGMTDHRSIEKTYLLREFEANGLVEKEIRPDGHCLFAAVADQLEQRRIPLLPVSEAEDSSPSSSSSSQPPPPYRAVRRRATDYMEAHPDDFAPFLDEPLSSYVPKIRDTAEWGGQLELAALANAYGVEINVVQDGRTETIEPSTSGNGGNGGAEEQPRERIWLAYYRHGYGLGEHYNSLRKKS
ncbi:hypothetical protein DL768_010119 [Monosporascus sp. mg162]|nr:hypothetical protein DL768_010119 [Monosporascus sp. mg162]